jgi:L-ascorbate metabolism protein UlaG (beta-lactamase superfamily)
MDRPDADGPSLTFIGTATTLMRLGPFTVLTDPNFLHKGQVAYLGKGLMSRRLTDPAVQVDDLPPLSAVVLSHLHGDHFDRVARRGLDRQVPVVTTPPAARKMAQWGFRTTGLTTWDQHVLDRDGYRLTVQSLPAVHAYGVLGRLLPPVMGSMVTLEAPERRPLRIYLSGDTLLGDHLDAIAERHPTPDVAVVHLGGTRVLGRLVTLDGDGGVELLQRVRPRTAVPVHYDDYGVFRSPLSDFTSAWSRRGERAVTEVVEVARGSTVALAPRD